MSDSSAINSVSSIQMDYMQLLVTELQNQNPLEPMNNSEMASQLAQFSQLQQLESMNSSFANVLTTAERTYASSLIDKVISFSTQTEFGIEDITSGTVEKVVYEVDGEIVLVVGDHTLALEDVISVKN
jgi:flagellar basal-body rod modification protein FlgD